MAARVGIKHAPALTQADIVLVGSRLSAAVDAHDVAVASYATTKQNLATAFCLNGIGPRPGHREEPVMRALFRTCRRVRWDHRGMATTFTHTPHPRIEERRLSGPIKTNDQRRLDHPNPIVRLNARFGLRITVVVGTMWCAYLFTIVALVSAPSAFTSGNSLIIISWIAQTFLQLVLLPVIIVGQNIQARAADKRTEETYNDADAVLHEALQIQQHLAAQDQEIAKIVQTVQTLAPG